LLVKLINRCSRNTIIYVTINLENIIEQSIILWRRMTTYIGILAGALTTGCLIPQIIKSYKTKSAKDFSMIYLVTLIAGLILWIVYGLSLGDLPIIIANMVAITFIFSIVFIKLKY